MVVPRLLYRHSFRFHRAVDFALPLAILVGGHRLNAQITSGVVTGVVKDPQGGVIPGATIVLISETRDTRLAPAITNESGVYVLPVVPADSYKIEVSMPGFKTVQRTGLRVSGAESGDLSAVLSVTAEADEVRRTAYAKANARIEEALREIVRLNRQRQALKDLEGLGWEGDLDEMRRGFFRDFSELPSVEGTD